MTSSASVTRRDFLIAAAGGVAAVAGGLAGAPARAPELSAGQGKPALTVRSINQYIATAQREDEPTQLLLAAEVKRDVVAFLDQRFALTTAQRHALAALTDEDRQRISVAVETALRRHYRLSFRSAGNPARVRVADSSPPLGTNAMTLSINEDSTSGTASPVGGEILLAWPCPMSRGRA